MPRQTHFPVDLRNQNINTAAMIQGRSDGFPCDECRQRVKVLYARNGGRQTCPDCTPKEDQIVEVLE